jgi:hypothetical protein
MLRLRPFRQRQLPLTDRWFADAGTQRWLGGPGWPGLILDLHKRPGYGTSLIAALMAPSRITHVSLFVAGVEPANTGSLSCLLKNGFQPLDPAPDWEGTVYYARERPAAPSSGQDDEGQTVEFRLRRACRPVLRLRAHAC